MVMKLVDIVVQKRSRGNTVRPAISIPKDIWNEFKFVYYDKNIRDDIVFKLLVEQLDKNLISVET